MVTCAWCGSTFPSPRRDCPNCGGLLPAPGGDDPGPPPPPSPRALPSGFRLRVLYAGIETAICSLLLVVIVVVVSSVMTAFITRKLGVVNEANAWVLLFGGLFGVYAASQFVSGLRRGRDRIRLVERGPAVVGRIVEVWSQPIEMPMQPPYRIIRYSFEAGGKTHEGKVETSDTSASLRKAGQPVHVLYLASDPKVNIIYPPVGRLASF